MSDLHYLLQLRPVNAAGTVQPHYFGWGTDPQPVYGDTLDDAHLYRARVVDPLFTWTEELPLSDQGIGGRTLPAFGTVKLGFDASHAASNAEMTALGALYYDGQTVFLHRGRKRAAFSAFTRILFGATQTAIFDEDSVTLNLRDRAALFDVPFQQHTYSGGGDLDGGADLVGVAKPFMLGAVRNAEPVLLDATETRRLYQVHDGPIYAGLGSPYSFVVRERGIPFTLASVPDVLALGHDPTPGTCYVDFVRGVFRLSGKPLGLITFQGAADPSTSIPHHGLSTFGHGALGRYCVERNFILADVDIDDTALGAFDAETPGKAGIYITDATTTCGQVLDALGASAGAQWGVTSDGKFFMRRIQFRTPIATIQAKDCIEPPQQLATEPTVWSHDYQAQRNYRVMSETDLAPPYYADMTITAEFREFAAKEYRSVSTTDVGIRLRRKLARKLAETGCWLEASPHTTEAARRAALMMQERQTWSVPVRRFFRRVRAGDTVTFSYPLLGLESASDWLVRKVQEHPATDDQDDRTELVLWGPKQAGDA